MRTILISGANRGIGRSIAEKLLFEGHQLSLGVRNIQSLTNTNLDPEGEYKDLVIVNKYDAKEKNDPLNWVEKTIKRFGDIDTLINCAGVFHKTELNFNEGEEKNIDELWKVNVMGPWLLTRAAWPYLSRKSNSRIITLISMSGKRSKGTLAGYTSSKFALMGLCQTIRNEGWDKGIRVTTISPSWVNTDMANEVKSIDKSLMTQPEDISSIISSILKLPNSCIPFDISLNCNLEK